MTEDSNILIALRQDAQTSSRSRSESRTRQGTLRLGHLIPAMSRRASTRYFIDEAIDSAWLDLVASTCHRVDRALFPAENRESPLELLVFIRRVHDRQPGIYRFGADGWTIVANSDALDVGLIVLQPEFAESAAILLALGSLESGSVNSSHHHRRLLARAGAAMEGCWLTSIDAGYDASIFAGFIPASLRDLGLVDGYTKIQLLALAVGLTDSECGTRRNEDD